jgi:hypothetical protein
MLVPGSKTIFKLDEYDDFRTPAGDSAYGENTPTDDQYGSIATEFADLENLESFTDEPETYNKHICVQIVLDEETNNGGNLATVTKQIVDEYGCPTGVTYKNPAFDTRKYELELEDGTMDRIFANRIAANLYSQVDDKGRQILAFREIVGHKKNKIAMSKDKGFTVQASGHRKQKKTTHGWQIEVEFRDGTTAWMDMKSVKEVNPIELA